MSAREDTTCYLERSEVRIILIAHGDADLLRKVDALPIVTAGDMRGVAQTAPIADAIKVIRAEPCPFQDGPMADAWAEAWATFLNRLGDVDETNELFANSRPAQAAGGPVAWLDIRTGKVDWRDRVVATNPQYVQNNGPENFVALYASTVPSTDGGRLTFCETCNANVIHRRAAIVDGVQTFECPACAVAGTERGGIE